MANRIELDLAGVNKGVDCALLVGKADTFPYENGKRTSDIRDGVRLTVALQNARLAQLSVRYDHDPLPKVTDEQIEAATAACKFIYVQIPDATVAIYSSSSGGIGMTATASTAQIVTPEK